GAVLNASSSIIGDDVDEGGGGDDGAEGERYDGVVGTGVVPHGLSVAVDTPGAGGGAGWARGGVDSDRSPVVGLPGTGLDRLDAERDERGPRLVEGEGAERSRTHQ